jgi:CRISPR/Cas system-associated exonuclease Cas4 (RecB family)
VADLQNEFAWSWSRHRTFYECPRRTYWRYYGSWGGWEPDASKESALAYRLNQLKSLAMLVGESFHNVIGERLRMRSDAPSPVPIQLIRDEVERRLLKRVRESRNRDWERFGQPKQYAILFEDYYGLGVSSAQQEAAIAQIGACADTFGRTSYAQRSFAIPRRRLRIIDPTDFDDAKMLVDGVKVFAKPDLVVEDKDGALHIVDWKTGRPSKANIAQLAVYGLYVSEKLGAPIEKVVAHLVYLVTGEAEVYNNLREGVGEAQRMIATYAADVRDRLTDIPNNVAGDIEQFPMTANTVLCRRCNFREICGRLDEPPSPPPDDED